MKVVCIAVLLASVLAACAQKKAVVAPTPSSSTPRVPRTSRPVKKEPTPPPPLPLPQVGLGKDEQLLRGEAEEKVEGAERIVNQIDQKRLPQEQRDTFLTIQSFLFKAKEALTVSDFPRAFNLAEKAQFLAEELLQTIR